MKKILVLSFLLFTTFKVYCQTDPDIIRPQGGDLPNSSYGTTGNQIYNVDLFTGTASITIPIWDYQVDGLDVGVSLNYSARGIKVDDMASSIGLGWNLNYGSSLTRDVRVFDDDAKVLGYRRGIFRTTSSCTGCYGDAEPDVFYLTIAGSSYKFKLWPHSTFQIMPRHGIQVNISEIEDNADRKISVVDDKGNRYEFIRGDTTIATYEEPDYQNNPGNMIERIYGSTLNWVISKIITRSGKIITYEYVNNYVYYPNYKVQEISETGTNLIKRNKTICYDGIQKLISKITYPDGTTVNFLYDNLCGSKLPSILQQIQINKQYSTSYGQQLSYVFNYYYDNGGGGSYSYPFPSCLSLDSSRVDELRTEYRLILDNIFKKGTDNQTQVRYYAFEYNLGNFPYRLSDSKDIYGYYNGAQVQPINGNYIGVPYHSSSYNGVNYGVSKMSDSNYNKNNLISRIVNQYGGSTELNYRGHILTNPSINEWELDPMLMYVNANDGVCIKSIKETDGFKNSIETFYEFTGGQRFFKGGYYRNVKTNRWCNYMTSTNESLNGSHHGYSNITVTKVNNGNVQIDKKSINSLIGKY